MKEISHLLQQGVRMHQACRLPEAEKLYRNVLALQHDQPDALYLLGVIAAQRKSPVAAVELIGRAVAIKPEIVGAFLNYGIVLSELGQHEAAIASYDKAIDAMPASVEAHVSRGIALAAVRRHEAAIDSFDHAIRLQPKSFQGHNNRGNSLSALKRFKAAIESYDEAICIKPDAGEVHFNRGIAQKAIGQRELALQSFDRAVALNFNNVEIHYNRGLTLLELCKYEEAVVSFDIFIQLKGDHAKAYNDRGIALYYLRRYAAALASFEQAINLKRDYVDAYNNRGLVLAALNDLQGAINNYDEAIQLDPDCAEAFNNRGHALKDLQRYEAAINDYKKALCLRPDCDFLYGSWLHARMMICDWQDLDRNITELTAKIERGEKATVPFPVLGVKDSLALQRKAAEIWVADRHPLISELGEFARVVRHDKIRIGYFSGDYHNHATMALMAGLLECHDRHRFEIFALSFGPDSTDEMRQRAMSAVDHFIDVRERSDREVASLARSLEIDIAVDLKGLTQDARLGIFAYRAAPVQVSYLGYPGTTGAQYIDYLIADRVVIPEASRRHYTEKIVYLPDSYQVNDTQRKAADKVFSREEFGLPPSGADTGFVFCDFNASFKLTPQIFDSWMRILRRVNGSVLWLLENNFTAAINLRKEATNRGIDEGRLIFAPRVPLGEHLARHSAADLFLDTAPCNAHTTASDALWAGLPVLTRIGESFAGRVAASLLESLGMSEMIATTQSGYEERAVELATNSEHLRNVRQKLQLGRQRSSLFSAAQLTNKLEQAYLRMHAAYLSEAPLDHIFIEP